MDFIIYADKTHAGFPSVSASTSSPKTAYHPGTDIMYVNTGSGWLPAVQPGSNSVYTAYTTLDSTTKSNIITSVQNTSSAPHAAHKAIAARVTDLTNGR
ncbi:MAG TPA: hypothetical protein VJW20_16860 [Candidatus Angelobacter sp.]|nr:hypothetical protein [Candidatus Angelobacter sp.]